MAEVMFSFMDSIGAIKSAVIGYRRDLITEGIDPDAADTMTIDLHSYFLDILRSPYQVCSSCQAEEEVGEGEEII